MPRPRHNRHLSEQRSQKVLKSNITHASYLPTSSNTASFQRNTTASRLTFTMPRIRSYLSALSRGRQLRRNMPMPTRITAREPVPLDPERTSLGMLPYHIILLILRFIQDSSPGDVRKIAALSSTLYEMARYVQCHTLNINLQQSSIAHNRLDLLSRNLLSPAVRSLKVYGGKRNIRMQDEGVADEILTQLANMLPDMTGLRDLHWHVKSEKNSSVLGRFEPMEATVKIPLSIIHHLSPQVRLHTSVTCEDTPIKMNQGNARELLSQLTENKNLFSLSVEIRFWEELECRKTMHLLKDVLLSCPNLVRIPMLDVWYPHGPSYHGPADKLMRQAPYCGLGFFDGESPPALEELGINQYPWGERHSELSHRGFCFCSEYPERGSEQHYWAQNFDWSQLQRLNGIDHDLALDIAPKLTHLKEVVGQNANFLQTIPTMLKLLDIPYWSRVDWKPDSITRHGAELRKLRIHGYPQSWITERLLNDEDLLTLCNGLPHLEELAIDVAIDSKASDWPYSSLEIIAKFRSIRVVSLWFELGEESVTPPAPALTVLAARQMFEYLHTRNRNIRRLEVDSRASSTAGGLYYGEYHQYSWEAKRCRRFVCEIQTYDCDSARLSVTCPDFSDEMNLELDRLATENGEERRAIYNDSRDLLLKVAIDGPLSLDEYSAWDQSRKRPKAIKASMFRRSTEGIRRYISKL